MTYTASSGTLNSTIPYHLLYHSISNAAVLAPTNVIATSRLNVTWLHCLEAVRSARWEGNQGCFCYNYQQTLSLGSPTDAPQSAPVTVVTCLMRHFCDQDAIIR